LLFLKILLTLKDDDFIIAIFITSNRMFCKFRHW